MRFTIRFSDGGDGWIMAQVEEVPGAISQGRTREEARGNVVEALRLMLTPDDPSTDPDGTLVLAPETAADASLRRRDARPATPTEFAAFVTEHRQHLLAPDDEG